VGYAGAAGGWSHRDRAGAFECPPANPAPHPGRRGVDQRDNLSPQIACARAPGGPAPQAGASCCAAPVVTVNPWRDLGRRRRVGRRLDMKTAVPDLITNSYFPAIAAVELGFCQAEGLDLTLEHIFPVPQAMAALRDGQLDFVAGSAHATLTAFPAWQGAKLITALAQGMYWLLVLRSDLAATRGDVNAVKGVRICAASGVDLGLRRLPDAARVDPAT